MTSACVTTNLLDMRAEPRFDSERVNQLFFGDTVVSGTRRHGYCRVTKADGYRGWVDIRFLEGISSRQAAVYSRNIWSVVGVRAVRLFDSRHKEITPHVIYYGTRLCVQSIKTGWSKVKLPDGLVRFVKTSSLRPINRGKRSMVSGRKLAAEAMKFLGVPYLWGGISPLGFDCSGLVQTICARFGIAMPRDTNQQIGIGKRVQYRETRVGDLLFFKRHVGFALGQDRIIHASLGGGGVRINSLVPGAPDYRSDLDRDFQQARRFV